MFGLMAIYICPVHGEVLEDQVERVEEIDSEHDEIYPHYLHTANACYHDCTPKLSNGQQCWEQVSDERFRWWLEANQDEEDDETFRN